MLNRLNGYRIKSVGCSSLSYDKNNANFNIYLLTLGILFASQLIFLFLPSYLIEAFILLFRPALYASVSVILFVFSSRNDNRDSKARLSAVLAFIGGLIYFTALFIAGIKFGFGKNVMFFSLQLVSLNIWTYFTVVFTSEYLRIRIIKGAPDAARDLTAIALTLVYTFTQLDLLRNAANFTFMEAVDFFFVTAFPVFALNGVLSFISYKGSFLSVIILRSVYTLSLELLPVLPNISKYILSVISCSALFATAIMHHFNMRSKDGEFSHLAKKYAKYQKRTSLSVSYITPFVLIAVMAVFIMRGFTYFPVVVLTDSMTGVLNRGSVAFVEKLRKEDVFSNVSQGDIIHFKYKNIEMVHRVIDFRYNEAGERVYITKGDANLRADTNPVEAEQILGVAKAYIPHIGHPIVVVREIFDLR